MLMSTNDVKSEVIVFKSLYWANGKCENAVISIFAPLILMVFSTNLFLRGTQHPRAENTFSRKREGLYTPAECTGRTHICGFWPRQHRQSR